MWPLSNPKTRCPATVPDAAKSTLILNSLSNRSCINLHLVIGAHYPGEGCLSTGHYYPEGHIASHLLETALVLMKVLSTFVKSDRRPVIIIIYIMITGEGLAWWNAQNAEGLCGTTGNFLGWCAKCVGLFTTSSLITSFPRLEFAQLPPAAGINPGPLEPPYGYSGSNRIEKRSNGHANCEGIRTLQSDPERN